MFFLAFSSINNILNIKHKFTLSILIRKIIWPVSKILKKIILIKIDYSKSCYSICSIKSLKIFSIRYLFGGESQRL